MKKRVMFYLVVVPALLVMSVVMCSGIVRADQGPDGFIGIPWGASREVVEKEMAERHFPKDSNWKIDYYIYDGSFAGYPAYLIFHFENNKFVDGGAGLIEVFHSINDGTGYNLLADKYFSILEGQLIEKYGEPYYRYKAEGKERWKPYASYWEVKYYPLYPSVIEEHTIGISVGKCHAFKDRNIDEYSKVFINYTNATLKENEKKRSRDQDI